MISANISFLTVKSYLGKRRFDIGIVLFAVPLWVPLAVVTGLVDL
jgi:hypothetical protein